jgi:predicted ATPase
MQPARSDTPSRLGVLGVPAWSQCERLIRSFEEACREGRARPLEDYLGGEGEVRLALLVELTHIDLEFRLQAGEAARVESYRDRFPELADDAHALRDLIAAEYALRCRHESGVGAEEYLARFPDHAAELRERLAGRDATAHPPGGVTVAPSGRPDVPGYEMVAELGRGGMGVVYKAHDLRLGRPVALKFLPEEYNTDPERLERFLREARTASALNHPHICTVHGLGEHGGRPFIVLEFIEGRTLTSLVGRPAAELCRAVAQAARALAAAHAAGVVHRDIKPDNLMVRPDGYVKVLDFGLARRLPTLTADPGARDTAPGVLLGTAAYMSPEQAMGTPAGAASDVFSLGIVLYELATGRHPFEGETTMGVLLAITGRQPVPPSRLNPELPAATERLIGEMLNKSPQLRPTAQEVAVTLEGLVSSPPASSRPVPPIPVRPMVGRQRELGLLREALADAEAGRPTLLCVAGEPGIGKSTLVEHFIHEESGGRLFARGRCSERLAGAAAYLPVLEALEDLLGGEHGPSVARLMKVVAPSWYAEVAPADPGGSPAPAASQQALLREFRALLEGLTRLGTVVLLIGDVHWADVPTTDLLAHVGRQLRRLPVLVVATCRTTELLIGPHPFHQVRRDLQGQGLCREVTLGLLAQQDVDSFLAIAFPGHGFPPEFAGVIHARTEGSPLFMNDLLRHLRERGVIAESGGRWTLARRLPDLSLEMPVSVRGTIQRKLDRLANADLRLLIAAAVQGPEFDSAVVAGALRLDPADVEERLSGLERVHGMVRLIREGEFPDRTLSLRYGFAHAFYQQALYAELTPTRRATWSASLARALEARLEGDGLRAAELACLWEAGRDPARAAGYFHCAAENAAKVFAHREAAALARRGLGLLAGVPDSDLRAALEQPLQTALGLQLQVLEGFADPEAWEAYARARELCPRVAGSREFPILWGLWVFHKVRSELSVAAPMAGELLGLARREGDPRLELQARQALAVTSLCRGEPADTILHMRHCEALYDPARHRAHHADFGLDPGVACKAFGAVALWLTGDSGQAVRVSDEAVRLGRKLSQPFSLALVLHFASMLHQCRRDPVRTAALAGECRELAEVHGFSFWLAGSKVLGGWTLASSGNPEAGLTQMRQGLGDWLTTGSITYLTYYLGLLAEVLVQQGRDQEARLALDEGLAVARRTGETFYEAELHRLGGELLSDRADMLDRAGACFRLAAETARNQGARVLELRAATSLARFTGDRSQLRPLLTTFPPGADTADHREARRLLD